MLTLQDCDNEFFTKTIYKYKYDYFYVFARCILRVHYTYSHYLPSANIQTFSLQLQLHSCFLLRALHGNNLLHHLDRSVINQVNHLTALAIVVVVEYLCIHSGAIAAVAHIMPAVAVPLYCRQSKYLLWH